MEKKTVLLLAFMVGIVAVNVAALAFAGVLGLIAGAFTLPMAERILNEILPKKERQNGEQVVETTKIL